jgi:NADH pyrophosphatase NudC (nudix superfamily)
MFEAERPMQEFHREMTTLDPELTTFFAITMGIGYLMIQSGLQKSMLEWRRRKRTCPSCGRETRVCGCT